MMHTESNAAHGAGTADRTARLREEIEFWAGMLDAADDSVPLESMERMTFALALAEFRLRELQAAAEENAPPACRVLPFQRHGG
jgi:hypothetical protein